ncbi:MAG: DUF4411 family protein [Candidatus Omnitrophica bacterium]|nr:DUF4411 family protein [Candidatus Omnitrophota bacterium]
MDANVYIEAWNKYYSNELCPLYWEILDKLAREGRIFSPIEVRREIEKTDDKLWGWAKEKPHLFRDIDNPVQEQMRIIMARYGRLVDSIKQRSIADPWVVALAVVEGATVVTKEEPAGSSGKRIKIPDVCNLLKVSWMNDFEFAKKVGIKFSAVLS